MEAEYMMDLQQATSPPSEHLKPPQLDKMKVGKYKKLEDEAHTGETDQREQSEAKSNETVIGKLKEMVRRQIKDTPLEDPQKTEPITKVGKYNKLEEKLDEEEVKTIPEDQPEESASCRISEENSDGANSNQTDTISMAETAIVQDEMDSPLQSDSFSVTTFQDDFTEDGSDDALQNILPPVASPEETVCSQRILTLSILGVVVIILAVLYIFFKDPR